MSLLAKPHRSAHISPAGPGHPVLLHRPWSAVAIARASSLFPDYAGQAEPPEGEPVFALTWGPAELADDHIQPDAPDNFGA